MKLLKKDFQLIQNGLDSLLNHSSDNPNYYKEIKELQRKINRILSGEIKIAIVGDLFNKNYMEGLK